MLLAFVAGLVIQVQFVGAALVTVRTMEPRDADRGLALLGLLLPPVWALVVHARARRCLLDGYESV